jgi:protein-disulfide isomerase
MMMDFDAHAPRLAVPVTELDHIRGPLDAALTLVEYGDFECPHCGAAYPVIEDVRMKMGQSLRFVYRHFPLPQVHPHAVQAAEAAEAAGAQRRFWPMHDMLFENQQALDRGSLLLYATRLQLDVQAFTRDLVTHAHKPSVERDFMGGVRSGVNGTPTLFINGARYDGPRDVPSMVRVLNQVLRVVQVEARTQP